MKKRDGYALTRAEVALEWDFNDVGLFFVQSIHRRYCPKTSGYYDSYDPYRSCFLNRLTYVQRAFARGEITDLDYVTGGPLDYQRCGYNLCPYEEEKPCYSWHRRTYVYPRKGYSMIGIPREVEKTSRRYLETSHALYFSATNHRTAENPCWNYLRVSYTAIRDPYLDTVVLCLRYYRQPYDNPPPGNPCAY